MSETLCEGGGAAFASSPLSHTHKENDITFTQIYATIIYCLMLGIFGAMLIAPFLKHTNKEERQCRRSSINRRSSRRPH